MILDELLEIGDALALNTGAAGTYLIGDQIDLGAAARDIGNGEPLYLVVTVDTSIITAGSAGTVQFKLVSDDTASIATDGSATEHYASKAFVTDDAALNELDAGALAFAVALPMEGPVYERYLGLLQLTGTTAISAGKINAFLTRDVAKYKAYANAI
jgi:hypothetical protein